jgi:hypothetical protein
LISRAGWRAIIIAMSDDEQRDNFEDSLRAMAQGIGDSLRRLAGQDFDFDEVVRATGLDPEEAKRWAGQWLHAHRVPAEDPLRGAGPHPLDLPTEEQGMALAALESGRWTVEPGTSMLVAHGEGPAPRDALGLVRELRVRDWLDGDGALTLAGRRALARWLDR